MEIDEKARISQYFTYREALWLPRWNRMANEQDGLNDQVLNNLKHLYKIMDLVRAFLNSPITVTICYRPKEYNKLIGGATSSAHMCLNKMEAAVDFVVKGMTAQQVRDKLKPKLEEFELRMEDIQGNWIHVDTREPGPSGRFFKP